MPREISKDALNDIISEIDDDQKSCNSSNKFVRLSLEKNDEAVVRILPVKISGPLWYAKIAKHWVGRGKAIVTCKKLTGKRLGGDPDCECEACEFVEKYRNDKDTGVADRAFSIIAKPAFTVYLKVRSSNSRSFLRENEGVAHEFTLYPGAMDDLLTIYKRYANRGIFLDDPIEGFDLLIHRGKKGTQVTIDEQRPLFDGSVAEQEKKLAAILRTVSFKAPSFPTSKEMRKFLSKAEDYCYDGGDDDDDDDGGNQRRRGDRSSDDGDDRRSSRSDDRRSSRSDDRSERHERRGKDDFVDDEEPRSRSRNSDPDDAEPKSRSSRNSDPDDDEIPGIETPPPSRRSNPPPRPPAARIDDEAAGGDDEDDTVAEEMRDPVPPREPNADDDEPPADDVRPPASGSLRSRLRNRL